MRESDRLGCPADRSAIGPRGRPGARRQREHSHATSGEPGGHGPQRWSGVTSDSLSAFNPKRGPAIAYGRLDHDDPAPIRGVGNGDPRRPHRRHQVENQRDGSGVGILVEDSRNRCRLGGHRDPPRR